MPKTPSSPAPAKRKPRQVKQAAEKATTTSAGNAAPPPPMIVGIGASAGGLEAFRAFFSNMPADSGFVFVLVQHLSPTHDSMLAELISRNTSMPVTDAQDGERVVANHVYVISPDATLTIADSALQLSKPAPPRIYRWPINAFFTSLAEDQGDCAVCIVLAGTGSDGALGLRAIKEHGGLTMAQSGFDHVAMSGMPASAASTGLVDDILPVEKMPARLLEYHKQILSARQHHDADGLRRDVGDHLQALCQVLRAEVGHDFSQYKRNTLMRRIQRRMLVRQTETVPAYIEYLKRNPQESEQLFREMLIGVTGFFRDQQAFAAVQDDAIPAMLARKDAADDLRIWVPGCATGEEAYSIAMLLGEAMATRRGPKVCIFATDIDERAIAAARAGRFRAPLHGVSDERRERWFHREGEDYCVTKTLREMCVFSPHSVIKDPPFSRLDMVSCRNLLIYLGADLQERLLQTFHYALRPGGFLLLGSSEGLGRCAHLFAEVDKKHRVYSWRDAGPIRNSRPANFPPSAPSATMRGREAVAGAPVVDNKVEFSLRQVLDKYAPACVLIDANHDAVRFIGDTGRYLAPSTGAASLNLFSLLQPSLREPARALVRRAFIGAEVASKDNLSAQVRGQSQLVRLSAEPLRGADGKVSLCVLVFDEQDMPAAPTGVAGDATSAELARVQALEHELEASRAQLQMAVEMHESASEELKSANEEYQSVNEELQSANEELETSKEEMQSINEELQVVNTEINGKNETLARLHSDLTNMMDSTQICMLFLDRDMHVRDFTPAMTDVFHLREGDRGRPITEISPLVSYPQLKQDIGEVLRNLGVIERTLVGAEDASAWLLRMRPYRTVDQVIDGVVLTFVDITERQRHEVERGRLAAIVESSADAIIGYALDDRIDSWNASAQRLFGYPASEVIGQPVAMVLPIDVPGVVRAWTQPGVFDTVCTAREGGEIPVTVTKSPVKNSHGHVLGGSLIVRDITERKQAEKHTQVMLGELNHRVKNTLASVQAIAMQTFAVAPSLEAFKNGFLGRLHALSLTHDLLAAGAWTAVGLKALVLGELAPYGDDERPARVNAHGAAVQLSPKMALALSMALHELATNAVKYGALSVPQGNVEISWETDAVEGAPWLRICWRETGGPATREPDSRGFGTRLLAVGVPLELDGRVALDFLPDGVQCIIDAPLGTAETAP